MQESAGKPHAQAVEKDWVISFSNIARMQYRAFPTKGFFIGSGLIEAGCKTVIGARCKQPGMFWG